MPTFADYLADIAGEHADKPDFVATVSLSVQPYVDMQAQLATINADFDLDTAVGNQLDVLGQWIGVSRYLDVPLQVYFSLDTVNLGFDQGVWYGPFDPVVGLVALDDPHYRILLKARAVANQWDGTVPGAYAAWDALFTPEGYSILIQSGLPQAVPYFTLDAPGLGFDEAEWYNGMSPAANGSMTVLIALLGPPIDAITLALFTGGYLGLAPAGVFVFYVTQSVPNEPMFCFDAPANTSVGGFDIGNWGIFSPIEA